MKQTIVALWAVCWVFYQPSHTMAASQEARAPEISSREIEKITQKSLLEGKMITARLTVKVPGSYERARDHRVPYGMTASKLLEKDYSVGRGVVCCHPDDVKSVNGLDTDFAKRKYWVLSVNGDRDVSPSHTLLRDGDRVIWTYKEDPGFSKAVCVKESWPEDKS